MWDEGVFRIAYDVWSSRGGGEYLRREEEIGSDTEKRIKTRLCRTHGEMQDDGEEEYGAVRFQADPMRRAG